MGSDESSIYPLIKFTTDVWKFFEESWEKGPHNLRNVFDAMNPNLAVKVCGGAPPSPTFLTSAAAIPEANRKWWKRWGPEKAGEDIDYDVECGFYYPYSKSTAKAYDDAADKVRKEPVAIFRQHGLWVLCLLGGKSGRYKVKETLYSCYDKDGAPYPPQWDWKVYTLAEKKLKEKGASLSLTLKYLGWG